MAAAEQLYEIEYSSHEALNSREACIPSAHSSLWMISLKKLLIESVDFLEISTFFSIEAVFKLC